MSSDLYYAVTAGIAILLLILQNYDIMFKKIDIEKGRVWLTYKRLMYAVLVFHLTDVVWGLFYDLRSRDIIYVDNFLYFEVMALCVVLWTKFAVTYVGKFGIHATLLIQFGKLFFVAVTGMVIANIFTPIIFHIDQKGNYYAGPLRWTIHTVQIALVIAVSVYCFFAYFRDENSSVKNRYRTIGWFGVIMAIFLFLQLWYPLLPLYTMAYMIGTCMIKMFVVNDERDAYKKEIEEAYIREKQQLKELIEVRRTAYVDPLTKVRNKSSFAEFEAYKNIEIQSKESEEFAIGVFDLNGLKVVNDTYGHEKGDEYIISGCQAICKHFAHCPVYRIGGDEFVAVFMGNEYAKRYDLEYTFNQLMDRNNQENKVVVAMGISEYIPESDYTLNDVFARADEKMYARKRELKGIKAS